jgi:hypothetical protein
LAIKEVTTGENLKMIRQILFVIVAVVAVSTAAMGQANKLSDLVGARAGQAEGDLENRGYVLTHSDKSGWDSYGYWWSPSAKKCVVVRTSDGRYASIVDTMNFDCNQKASTGMSSGAKAGVAVGVTAAAIIGAIALSHKSHNHDDQKHYEDENKEAEYERGHRDGLYNSSYHNYNNSKEYSSGYGSGVAQRNNNLNHSTGWGGYRPHVNIADLRGARASSGESEMQSRGFRNVDGFKSGTTSYTIWWNGRTGQCVQVATADGRYDSVMDIGQHPKCR